MQISSYPKIDKKLASELLRPRPLESHKGIFGHLLLVAGHHGMMGAAVLCADAAFRAGIGKISSFKHGYPKLSYNSTNNLTNTGQVS